MSSCLDCGSDLHHCHGTLVIHSDRTRECTEPACDLPDLLSHTFVIDCRIVSGGCCAADDLAVFTIAS